MRTGLFEALTGRFADGTPVRDLPEERHRLRGVTDNLSRLFSSRRGSVDHLPEYGLPDLSALPLERTEGAAVLAREIEAAVRRYEPRLHRARVVLQEEDRGDARFVFRLTAELAGGEPVEFRTTFVHDRLADVTAADPRP